MRRRLNWPLLFVFAIASLPAMSQTDSEHRAFIQQWEGIRYSSYKDTTGNWTVGIGHKLKPNEYKSEYTYEEIETFWHSDLRDAKYIATRIFGPLVQFPLQLRLVLVDLAFNLGYSGLNKFVKFRAAISTHNYKLAAQELENSLYTKQTGRRAAHHIKLLGNL